MESLNREQVRTLIGRFYIENYHAGKVFTFKHFSAMGIQKSLIYRVIQRYEEGSDAKHKSGAGRLAQKLPPKQARRLVAESTGRVGVSTRKLASKYGISPRYVRKTLAKNGVTYRKRQPSPRYSPGQAERARAAADDLRRNFFSPSSSTEIVMDDESYFPLKDDNFNGNSGFYVSPECPLGDVPEDVRLRAKSKYPEKLLVWIAISEEPTLCQTLFRGLKTKIRKAADFGILSVV